MTPEGKPNIVWILGAGFSKPLGGPLLVQLLSPGSFLDLTQRFSGQKLLVGDASQWAVHIYHYGRNYEEGGLLNVGVQRPPGEFLWGDAEVFIDYLDAACAAGTGSSRIARISQRLQNVSPWMALLPNQPAQLDDMVPASRRLIAAECSVFVEDGDVASERWQAHRKWLSALDNRHTIVTFNYDRVIEEINDWWVSQSAQHFAKVLLPHENPFDAAWAGRARVLKLHGSVDWQATRRGQHAQFAVHTDSLFALSAPANELALATPGPTKATVTGELQQLWGWCRDDISTADAIVFIGYRFPPTDTQSREQLLGMIRQNASSLLHLHVVLGPEIGNKDVVRLAALLKFACEQSGRFHALDPRGARGRYQLHVHPLYAEDFFSIYQEVLLVS